MADEQQFAPGESPDPRTAPGEAQPEEPATEPAENPAPEEPTCPIEMGWRGPRCRRKLHPAPDGIDEQPVCLMHSKDPAKQSGPLFDAFRQEFERILKDAGEGEAHFEKFAFPELNFIGRTIKAICHFRGATFTEYADFSGATFTQNAYFSRVTFTQNASFLEATFTQVADFSGATFTRNAYFGAATFTQNAYLGAATFTQDADFSGATFTRNAYFGAAIFTQKAYFNGATFTQDADFSFATFTQNASFLDATFTRNADFSGATFTRNADFRRTTFTQNADFERTEFYGTAHWRYSRFLDQAEFRHTAFNPSQEGTPSAVFSLAKFAKPKEVVFDDVDLSRALFLNCDLSEFSFTSSVRWAERDGNRGLAVFEEKLLLDPTLSVARVEYGPIDHGAVEQIYHQLKKNYDAGLDYRKANDFHFGEMEMRRLEPHHSLLFRHGWMRKRRRFNVIRYAVPLIFRIRRCIERAWRWLRPGIGPEALYLHASDYGNSYAKPMLLLLLVFLPLFTALFPIPGLEQRQPKPGPTETYLTVWDKQNTWSNLGTESKLLVKSAIAALDTATFQRNPEYTPAYPWGRLLAILETLLTSTLFALFLLAIRRQFKR